MTLCSSGKRESVTDSDPWRCPREHPEHEMGHCRSDHAHDVFTTYAPRPEFDRPLTNPANPILAIARKDAAGVGRPLSWWIQWAMEPVDYRGVHSLAQIDHARKVLQRLAALS